MVYSRVLLFSSAVCLANHKNGLMKVGDGSRCLVMNRNGIDISYYTTMWENILKFPARAALSVGNRDPTGSRILRIIAYVIPNPTHYIDQQ